MLNLKSVQVRDNFFGQIIVENYVSKPHDVLDMIKEQYKDNPEAVKRTLGEENVKRLGLLNPLARFEDYFPSKASDRSERSGYLIFSYDDLRSLVNALKRARGMISDLGLNLTAQGYAHKPDFRLYIIR